MDKLEQERSQLKTDNDRLEQRVSVDGFLKKKNFRSFFFFARTLRVEPFRRSAAWRRWSVANYYILISSPGTPVYFYATDILRRDRLTTIDETPLFHSTD